VLTGDHIDAQEAYRIGFLERLVPLAGLDAAVESWVSRWSPADRRRCASRSG
jgi:enoyl-CoA hydratase/carnithine racemase